MKKVESINPKRSQSPMQQRPEPHKMEVVSEGSLESISRPCSRQPRSVDLSISMSMKENSCMELEVLPNDRLFQNNQNDDLLVEDIRDSTEVDQNLDKAGKNSHRPSPCFGRSRTVSSDIGKKFQEERTNVSIDNNRLNNTSPNIDPKIQRGFEKIKKLDQILAEKIKKEKEVKSERKLMHRDWQIEIQRMFQDEEKSIAPNIKHLLTLTTLDDKIYEDDDGDISPVFPTQVNMASFSTDGKKEPNISTSEEKSAREDLTSATTNNTTPTGKKKDPKKNFIRRNVQLAGHANEIIAFTDEERMRLDELLANDMNLLLVDNPFTRDTTIKVPIGYQHEESSLRAIEEIDIKLKDMIPSQEFESICFTPTSEKSSLKSTMISNELKDYDIGNYQYGELVLQEEKQLRDMKQRLSDIEFELTKLHGNETDPELCDTPKLSEDFLRRLLDSDLRLTSSALSIFESVNDNLSTERSESIISGNTYDNESVLIETSRSSISEI